MQISDCRVSSSLIFLRVAVAVVAVAVAVCIAVALLLLLLLSCCCCIAVALLLPLRRCVVAVELSKFENLNGCFHNQSTNLRDQNAIFCDHPTPSSSCSDIRSTAVAFVVKRVLDVAGRS